MQIHSDNLPRSRLFRSGGFVGGIVLSTPLFFVLLDAATSVVPSFAIGSLTPSQVLLSLAIAAATVTSGVSLFGYDWIHAGSRFRRGFVAGTVLVAAIGCASAAAALFADAMLWGAENRSVPVLGIGVAGLLGLTWVAVRGSGAVRAGYRSVE